MSRYDGWEPTRPVDDPGPPKRNAYRCTYKGVIWTGRLLRVRDTSAGPIADFEGLEALKPDAQEPTDLGDASVWLPASLERTFRVLDVPIVLRWECVGKERTSGDAAVWTFRVAELGTT